MGTWARVVTESSSGVITSALTGNVTGNVTGDLTGDVTGDVTGTITGNADTATALATGRTIGMTGDVVWTSASFDGSGNVTGTAVIQNNSVDLTTHSTGNYVATVTAGTGLTSTGATTGEGVGHSLSVDAGQPGITSIGPAGTLTVNNDLTVGGDLIVSGDTIRMDVAELLVEDKIISLANVNDAVEVPTINTAHQSGVQIETYAPADGVYEVTISNGGSGYSAGNWTTTGGGSGASGAQGTFSVSGDAIDGFVVQKHGTGYTEVPTIVLPDNGGGTDATVAGVLGNELRNPALLWSKSQGAGHTDGTGGADGLTGWTLTNAASTARNKIPIAVMQFSDTTPTDEDGEGIGTFHFEGDAGKLYIRTS